MLDNFPTDINVSTWKAVERAELVVEVDEQIGRLDLVDAKNTFCHGFNIFMERALCRAEIDDPLILAVLQDRFGALDDRGRRDLVHHALKIIRRMVPVTADLL